MSRVIMISKFSRFVIVSSVLTTFIASPALAQVGTNPTLKLVTPSENQTLYGEKVPVLLSVENFKIVDYQTNKTNVPGLGHIHIWLDDPNPTRDSAVKLVKEDFTYSDVPFGNHTLKAELVANDHTSLKPPALTTVNFKTAPTATPSPPVASGFDKNTALVILVVVALVIVAAWWYTKEEDLEEKPKSETPKSRKSPVRKKTRRA